MHTIDLLGFEMETILQSRDTLEGMNFYTKHNFLPENISMTSLSGATSIFAVLKEN